MPEFLPGAEDRRSEERAFFEASDALMHSYDQDPTRLELPPVEYSFRIGDAQVSLGGYIHDPSYLDAHREQMENHLRGSTVLVIEQAELAESSISEQARRYVAGERSFFVETERIAHKQGVPVVSNDPYGHPRIANEGIMRTRLDAKNSSLTELKVEAVLASLAVTGGALGLDIYDKAKKKLSTVMSRRTFIAAGASALVGGMTATSLYGTLLNNRSAPVWRRGNSPVGPLLFDAEDYRDVASAYTIATLARDLPKDSKISVVYGVGHMRAIKHYLDSPSELAVKMALYRSVFNDAIPESKVFIPIQGVGESAGANQSHAWRNESQTDFTRRLRERST